MGHHVYNDNYNKYNFGNVLQGASLPMTLTYVVKIMIPSNLQVLVPYHSLTEEV